MARHKRYHTAGVEQHKSEEYIQDEQRMLTLALCTLFFASIGFCLLKGKVDEDILLGMMCVCGAFGALVVGGFLFLFDRLHRGVPPTPPKPDDTPDL
jgi:hypothetical protein